MTAISGGERERYLEVFLLSFSIRLEGIFVKKTRRGAHDQHNATA